MEDVEPEIDFHITCSKIFHLYVLRREIMKLFEPINVGGMELKNRIMFPPMVSKRPAGQTGFVTEDLIDLYVSIVKGGVGILVVEFTSIWPPQILYEFIRSEMRSAILWILHSLSHS